MAKGKKKVEGKRDRRINIKLHNEEEIQIYIKMKVLAASRDMLLRDLVLDIFRQTVG